MIIIEAGMAARWVEWREFKKRDRGKDTTITIHDSSGGR
jgi:hypothetical protein